MGLLDNFRFNKARARSTALIPADAGLVKQTNSVITGNIATLTSEGVANTKTLRNHVKTNPFLNSAVVLRKAQVASADWSVLVRSSDIRMTAALASTQQEIISLLESPNKNGRNTSFAGLLEPVVDDILTLGLGAIMPERELSGKVIGLHYVDAARVKFIPGWGSDSDGPRYLLMNSDGRTAKPLNNNELITMVLNPTTYNETGYSPVQVLHDKLGAFYDAFRSAWVTQKKRSPAGVLNLENMPEPELLKLQRLFEAELEGNSVIAFMNHPIDDLKYIQLGDVKLKEQGADWFMDFIIKSICAVFQVSPIMIQWTEGTNRATARESVKISGDQGIVPLMQMVAGFINREVIATFNGGEKLSFVWNELLTKDTAQNADTLRKRAGTLPQWATRNELRRADGLDPMHTDPNDPLYPFYNEINVWVGTGQEVPVSIAMTLPQYQSFEVQQEAKIQQAEANRGPEPQTPVTPDPNEDEDEIDEDEGGAAGRPEEGTSN